MTAEAVFAMKRGRNLNFFLFWTNYPPLGAQLVFREAGEHTYAAKFIGK